VVRVRDARGAVRPVSTGVPGAADVLPLAKVGRSDCVGRVRAFRLCNVRPGHQGKKRCLLLIGWGRGKPLESPTSSLDESLLRRMIGSKGAVLL